MRKFNLTRGLFLMLLAVLVCMLPVAAASGFSSEAGTVTNGYTVDGIDAYKEPFAASSHFTVEELIYFTLEKESQPSDQRIIVVDTMDALVSAAKAHPFAALVVDAKAEPSLDRDAIICLAKTQHIILIIGFDTAREEDLDVYATITGHSAAEKKDIPGFASYYVVAARGEIALWDMIWGQELSIDDILNFAEETKNGIFFLQDGFVLEECPELVEEINNTPLPAENIISVNNEMPYADWNPAENNEVKIYNPHTLETLPTYINVYESAGSYTKIMSSYVGEALLFTGNQKEIDTYIWYEVRGWKQSGSSSTFVSGWVKAFHPRHYVVQTETYIPSTNGGFLAEDGVSGVSYNRNTKVAKYTLTSSAKLYNSAGTLLRTLSRGDKVSISDTEGYAGASKPYLVSISGYTIGNTYYSATATTFADLNFDSGNTATYRIATHS